MSGLLTAEVKDCLKPHKGVNVIVGVGNSFRRDDGVGPYIAARLINDLDFTVFNAGITPENFIDKIAGLKPSYIIFIDAADFGGIPGEARNIDAAEISEYCLSTHMVSLGVITAIICSEVHADIGVIGIQPYDVGLGEGLSSAVLRSANEIIREIKEKR